MRCTNGRVIRPERLDALSAEQARPVLRDLVRINSWLGGHRILPRLLGELVRPQEHFSILDIGAASGDVPLSVRRRYPGARITCLDSHASHLAAAPAPRVTGDAFRLPFREASFDFVTCSLFLHHFGEPEIRRLLDAFRRIARRAVVAVDLERHPLAYGFLPATRWLFGWHEVTLHDGPRSVEAGFRPAELAQLAREAGAAEFRVRRHRPWFRLSLVLL